MQKRVIANQMVLLTDDEYQMYKDICASYDRPPSMKGSDLFQDLIVSDNNGYITYIKPPSTRQTSMEVFLFICSIMQNQQLRLMQKQVDDLCANIKLQADKLFEEIKSDLKK